MEIHLTPDTHAKLSRIAAARGSDEEMLVREAIEQFVEFDCWFESEVDKGLASATRGELVSHEEVGQRLERRLADRQQR